MIVRIEVLILDVSIRKNMYIDLLSLGDHSDSINNGRECLRGTIPESHPSWLLDSTRTCSRTREPKTILRDSFLDSQRPLLDEIA